MKLSRRMVTSAAVGWITYSGKARLYSIILLIIKKLNSANLNKCRHVFAIQQILCIRVQLRLHNSTRKLHCIQEMYGSQQITSL